MKERAKDAALLVGFLMLLGIVGRAELDALPECGLIREEAEWIERSCLTEAEVAERLDMIRRTKGGDRFDSSHEAWMEFSADCDELLPPERGYCVELRTQEWNERGN